jgi:hypothetical protein
LHGAFEVFARSQSKAYFDRSKVLLGIENKDALARLLEDFRTDRQCLPRWGFPMISIDVLLGFDKLATKP